MVTLKEALRLVGDGNDVRIATWPLVATWELYLEDGLFVAQDLSFDLLSLDVRSIYMISNVSFTTSLDAGMFQRSLAPFYNGAQATIRFAQANGTIPRANSVVSFGQYTDSREVVVPIKTLNTSRNNKDILQAKLSVVMMQTAEITDAGINSIIVSSQVTAYQVFENANDDLRG